MPHAPPGGFYGLRVILKSSNSATNSRGDVMFA